MPVSANTPAREDWTITFAFWGTLLVAGVLFAAVSLSPRLKTFSEQQSEFVANQQRLDELERQAEELERVAAALENDPAFADELARVEFAASRPGEERIAVDRTLRLGGQRETTGPVLHTGRNTVATWPLPGALLEPLATHGGLRATLLAIAAALILVAFAVLHEEQAATVQLVVGGLRRFVARISDRYLRT